MHSLTHLPRYLLCALALLLAACAPGAAPESTIPSPYLIEPVFAEFYDFLGGPARLGPALTPVLVEGIVQKQYLENALMVYNPELPPSEQYSLAPLGEQMGVWDAPVADGSLQGALVVDGYIVYEGFAPLYQQLGGRYVGRPLTGVRFVAEHNRVEQYFQNLGFYMNLEQPGAVQLMAYGRLACGEACSQPQAGPAAIIQIDLPYGEPFTSTIARLGDGFVGPRLAGPYQTADGSLEVIYQNLVLFAHPDASQTAAARPLPGLLGITPEPLVAQLDSPVIMFYSIEGQYGYNIPLFFTEYIARHGGYEVVGVPISEIKMQPDGSASQCFTNACLRYAGGSVTPLPLGVEYKARVYDQPAAQPQSPGAVRIQVWEQYSQINSQEQQVIFANLYAGNQLLTGLQPYLEVSLPSGGVSIHQFPPSDEGGQTQLTLPPIAAPNGTLVAYRVCLSAFGAAEVCVSESFMIWGN
ncbi:MAG: hypothetical protein KIS85_02365 [Anaerolineales bacterium]|nr:hypothetical protein [Anaerolineales bacterium]